MKLNKSAIISVIVPVYKVEPYLHRCVDSILAQTFSDFELILVDDGSPDNCPAICDEYAKKDSRIVVIHQENGGLSAARNAGIDWAFANSDSEWITFIDSDDFISTHYLQNLYVTAIKFNVAISMCSLREVSEQSDNGFNDDYSLEQTYETTLYNSENAYINLYQECMTCTCKIYRKNLWLSHRFPLSKLHEDAFITHIMIFEAKQLAYIKAFLYNYVYNANSITRVNWTINRLDELDGHIARLAYLSNNSHNQAFERERNVITYCIERQINEITILPKDSILYKKNTKALRKKLIKIIKQYKIYFPFKHNYYIYENAFPFRLKIYWLCKGIIHKIKSVIGVTDAND